MNFTALTTIIFLLFLSCVIARIISTSNRDENSAGRAFLLREAEANSTRRADISSLDYINIPLSRLPLDALNCLTDENDRELSKKLTALADTKILNLTGYSNTDLKLMYGPANLEELMGYDANYSTLLKLLDKIGTVLYESGNQKQAEKFLEYAISIGSDISNTFYVLGCIYAESKNVSGYTGLLDTAQNIDSLSSGIIIRKLKEIHISD